ncbi:DUF2339 domain-containing protein [Myroides odoratus]|uniref:DUF2339 domain-containing protein n=1 Tax=Myroides odoratus TaxID=256 RepID=UPI0039AF7BCA
MEFILFILIVIVLVLLVRVTNKFEKVKDKLEQAEKRDNVLTQMLVELQVAISSLKKEGVQTETTPVKEDIKIIIPPPIPVETYRAVVPPVIEEPVEKLVDTPNIERNGTNLEAERIFSGEPYSAPRINPVPREQKDSAFIKMLKEVNWLNAIGIITLVLGIGFFVKYAIDQDWINEIGRVALGIAVGGIIVGIAHKLSAKYHVFSSILMGGGFATFYTTITLAFREYEIFSQTTAFVILIVLTILAILLSIAYKRQELAIFAFIGGMSSPLLVSTGAGNHLVLFSYILLLNTGVLFVAIRQKWLVIDKFSYILTYLYLFSWLFAKYKLEYQLDAIMFTALFFLQFMFLLVVRYIKNSKEKSNMGQLLYIVIANFTSLLSFFVIHISSSDTNYLGVISIAMALINALIIVGITSTKTAPVDKNFIYTLLALTIGLVSLAIPVQLSKVYITIVWAVEMSVLLWIWTRTKANLFRVGAILLGGLAIISYLMDIRTFNPTLEYNEIEEKSVLINLLPLLINQYTLTGIVILLSFFFIYYVLGKKPILEEETLGLKAIQQPTSQQMQKIVYILLFVLSYGIGFLEIAYQVASRVEYPNSGTIAGTYQSFSLVVYTVIYGAIYFALYKKQITTMFYQIVTAVSVLLVVLFTTLVSTLSTDIFYYEQYPKAYFALHLLAFGAFVYFYFRLYQNINLLKDKAYKWMNAILFATLVLLFSVELDNIVLWIISTPDTYFDGLSEVHAYGYPILWGLMAMILMIVGINKQKAELRKLSLISFGIIVLKFYLYDVWRMNQGGKIASFVVLGIILLVVSFLLERIKLLLKDQKQEANTQESQSENRS